MCICLRVCKDAYLGDILGGAWLTASSDQDGLKAPGDSFCPVYQGFSATLPEPGRHCVLTTARHWDGSRARVYQLLPFVVLFWKGPPIRVLVATEATSSTVHPLLVSSSPPFLLLHTWLPGTISLNKLSALKPLSRAVLGEIQPVNSRY